MRARVPSLARLRFRGLTTGATASLRLAGMRGHVHALPPIGTATHFTLIARLPAVADTQLGQIMAGLQRLHPAHHYYPPDTIHVTIRNLDEAAQQEADRPALFNSIRDVVEDSRPFALNGKGLGVSPNSVLLQLYPEDQGLAELRHRLTAATGHGERRRREGSSPWGELVRRYLFERMAFATLIRFSGPVTPAFLDDFACYRETDFGTFLIDRFEIVRTDKFLSKTGTEIIARMVAAAK